MEKKSKMKTEKEVAEQTLRDDLEISGDVAHKPAENSKQESLDYGKWALVAMAIVLAATGVLIFVIK